ncbi:methyltransferase domain-containing protein [bacterium]|nr:methyltransferase domain-containing protein [bacterium]
MAALALTAIVVLQFCLVAMIVFMIHWHVVALTSVPWVRTPRWKTRKMFALAGLKPGERVVDLGSGDGSTVIDAARDFGASGTGIETQFALVAISRLRARLAGVSDRAAFVRGDLFACPMPDADVVFSYLFPELNVKLEPLLKNRYPSGTRVVSRTFSFPTLPLVASETIGSETIYLYQVP